MNAINGSVFGLYHKCLQLLIINIMRNIIVLLVGTKNLRFPQKWQGVIFDPLLSVLGVIVNFSAWITQKRTLDWTLQIGFFGCMQRQHVSNFHLIQHLYLTISQPVSTPNLENRVFLWSEEKAHELPPATHHSTVTQKVTVTYQHEVRWIFLAIWGPKRQHPATRYTHYNKMTNTNICTLECRPVMRWILLKIRI